MGLKTIEAETGMDRHTVRKVLRGVRPDGDIKGNAAWKLSTFHAASAEYQTRAPEEAGPLKEQKTAEEIRKLRLANDAKAGLLVAKADVAAAYQRVAARIAHARTESENRDPLRLVGRDLPEMREGVRELWDKVGQALADCFVEWREQPKEDNAPGA